MPDRGIPTCEGQGGLASGAGEGAAPEAASPEPIDLLAIAPAPGEAPLPLAREPGFSLWLHGPPSEVPAWRPPGQGEVLVVLRGEASVEETAGRLPERRPPTRSARLGPGTMYLVAGGSEWRLSGRPGTVVLAASTPVPALGRRRHDLLSPGRLRLLALPLLRTPAPRLVFGGEALRAHLRGVRCPGYPIGSGFARPMQQAATDEYVVAIRGMIFFEVDPPEGRSLCSRMAAGCLLHVPAGSGRGFVGIQGYPAAALVLSSALPRGAAAGTDKPRGRGFSPFSPSR